MFTLNFPSQGCEQLFPQLGKHTTFYFIYSNTLNLGISANGKTFKYQE